LKAGKVAAETRRADPFPSFYRSLGRWTRPARRTRWVPDGTMHSYAEGGRLTACGLPLEGLTLFPEIDWPGGVALGNPRCGACGES
jgi:hypothetical protein